MTQGKTIAECLAHSSKSVVNHSCYYYEQERHACVVQLLEIKVENAQLCAYVCAQVPPYTSESALQSRFGIWKLADSGLRATPPNRLWKCSATSQRALL